MHLCANLSNFHRTYNFCYIQDPKRVIFIPTHTRHFAMTSLTYYNMLRAKYIKVAHLFFPLKNLSDFQATIFTETILLYRRQKSLHSSMQLLQRPV